MQDRYVGDVGDYGKYALLRHLCGTDYLSDVRLGIVWCYFPNESHNDDGRHIGYLQRSDYRDLDPGLFRHLKRVVEGGDRNIDAIQNGGLLPNGTVFVGNPAAWFDSEGQHLAPELREAKRDSWVAHSLNATSSCDLVFFDPDNGIESKSVTKRDPKAGKYVFWDEISQFWNRGQSLLIYHHLNRTRSAQQQIEDLRSAFRERLKLLDGPIPLRFRRSSARIFWLVPTKGMRKQLAARVMRMLEGGWAAHFDIASAN